MRLDGEVTVRRLNEISRRHTTHLGGRCWSLRGYFQNGLVGEHGGAFINHDETAIRNLAKTLGLKEEVVNGGDLPGGEEIYWFDGSPYTYGEANDDWGALGYPVSQSVIARRFDELAKDKNGLFVAADSEGVAGWIHVGADPSLTHDSVAEIKGLIVSEAHRGKGVGDELVAAAEAWCLRHGFRNVRVRSRVEREAAHGFYQRRGYQRQKTQHVFLRRLG